MKNKDSGSPFALAIHGGAGTLRPERMTGERAEKYKTALREALAAGEALLKSGKSALDAVEAAVIALEDNPLFNAGKGSVFNQDGNIEMEASVMWGPIQEAGAVSLLSRVKNPVSLARAVMEHSPHVMLTGMGAEDFALKMGAEMKPPAYFHTTRRRNQWERARNSNTIHLDHDNPKGTVGAVALDKKGHLAAATSTGGMTCKLSGRMGDTPVIGAGTYAKDGCVAVSCTGHGEFFIRGIVAYDVACLIEYAGLSLEAACQRVIHEKQKTLGGMGGLIAIGSKGEIALPFNTTGMYRGWVREGEVGEVAIF
ncbi:MAG: isoaspartyl peptidase/L-asparaginase [Bacteroidota bacterium]